MLTDLEATCIHVNPRTRENNNNKYLCTYVINYFETMKTQTYKPKGQAVLFPVKNDQERLTIRYNVDKLFVFSHK